MIHFQTEFKAVSAVQIHDPDYAVLFDNKGNVFAVLPRGKYEYTFWEEIVTHVAKKLDFELYCFAEGKAAFPRKSKNSKAYAELFLRREKELEKACKIVLDIPKNCQLKK